MRILFFLSCLFFLLNGSDAYALRESHPLTLDHRIHYMVFNPDDVHKFTGHYGYQSSIEFEEGEEVGTISMGDSVSWQVVPAGNRIFLKPMEQDATTNMTVITNRRLYHFELHAVEADEKLGINDPAITFEVRFKYPTSTTASLGDIQHFNTTSGPDLSKPELYNFEYAVSGNAAYIEPLRVFDDGEFTYFQFKDLNADLPGFFVVDSDGNEAIVNYRITGNYVVIERVTSQFTLRHGSDVICVFNQTVPLPSKRKPKKKFFGLFG